MKRSQKRLIALTLCLVLSLSCAGAALAEESETLYPAYLSISGTIQSITARVNAEGKELDGSHFVQIENVGTEGALTNFIVESDTLRLNENELKVGAKLTGWYDARKPVLAIYPPQFKAVAIAVDEQLPVTKLDRFDAELLSQDGMLKLNVGEETAITLLDGTAYAGDLANCDLAVFYTLSTHSLPAQTTPEKIIVLNLPAEEEVVPEEDAPSLLPPAEEIAAAPIVVAGELLANAPAAFLSEDGVIMVPLRVIAEALGYTVQWDAETAGVMLNAAVSLRIGSNIYTYQRTAPIELGTAPVLHNSLTYVPLNFFTQVAKLNNAYYFEGQLVIDNEEPMV